MSRTKKANLASARPRLRRVNGKWECSDGIVKATDSTFHGAYQAWLTKAIAQAMKSKGIEYKGEVTKLKPVLPVVAAEPPKLVTVTHSAEHGSKTFVNGKQVDLSDPYKGEVTVVPGTRIRPPLTLPQSMQVNAERARAVQAPIRSMSKVAA